MLLVATLALTVMGMTATPVWAQSPPTSGPQVWEYLNGLAKDERLPILEREATREGGFVLYGVLGIDRANVFLKLFNEKYPGIKTEFVRLRDRELPEKVLLEHRTGRMNADLAISNVPWMDVLKEVLAPYEPTSWGDFDERFLEGGKEKGWTAVTYELLATTIAWRNDRVSREEVPKTLDQVADPKWKGRLGATDQLEVVMDLLIAKFGEQEAMKKTRNLAAVKPRLYRSNAALSQALAAGEFDIAFSFYAHRPVRLMAQGAPVDFVFQDPLFGLGITISAMKEARHPYAAALFMEFLTQAYVLEQLDKLEGGRIFGNRKGSFTNKLSDVPTLMMYRPIPKARFSELNRLKEELFIRQ
jgi:iron(III) transport system substrate-binding protein